MSAGYPLSAKQQRTTAMVKAAILVHLALLLQLGRTQYTFRVDNVTENRYYHLSKTTLEDILRGDEHEVVFIEADHPEECEFISEFDPFHSLAGAVHTAYAAHLPLVLSPDHVWVTILQGVSIHNSRVLPDLQCYDQADVSDAGTVVCDSWNDVASRVQFGLDPKLPTQVTAPSLPFSTTSGAANMAAMTALASPYEDNLNYDTKTYCGIPKVTLLGTVQDWELLLQKAESLLSNCSLGWWLCALRPVLEEFVKTAKGQEDVSFWRNIYRFQPDEPQDGSGCWDASGWIITLYPYITQGTKGLYHENNHLSKVCKNESFWWSVAPVNENDQCPKIPELPSINTQDFPSGLSHLQVTCQSNEDRLLLVGGFLGKCCHNDTHAVRPVLGWFIANDSNGDVCQLSDGEYCEDDCACSGHGKCEKTQSINGAGLFGGGFGIGGGGLFGGGDGTGEDRKRCTCFPGWSSVDCSRKCVEGTCGELCGEFCEEGQVCDYEGSGHCVAAPTPSSSVVQDSSTTDVTSSSSPTETSTEAPSTTDVASTSPSPTETSTEAPSTTDVASTSPSPTETSTEAPSTTDVASTSPSPMAASTEESTTADVASTSPSFMAASTEVSTTADVASTSPSFMAASTEESTTTDVTSISSSSVVATPEPSNPIVDDVCNNMEELKEVFCKSDVAGVVTLKSNNPKEDYIKGRLKFVMSQKSGLLNMNRKTHYFRIAQNVYLANPSRFEFVSGDLLLMGLSMNKRLVELSQDSLLKHCEASGDILKNMSGVTCGV